MLVAFAPPIVAGMIYPDGFLVAIGWAGLAATIWSVIIPALLLRAARQRNDKQVQNYRVWGGNFTIYGLLVFGCVVGICHILFVFELLPMYQ